ncbi:DUF3768 domain-containing protein [Rhizobium sp. SGZ-381]|uniref:DUF3768 domain-containing protein n=1 Tax=Rhizobium sp. SGZ-381 TaxID=3342800 RepID=UPI00366D8281
MVAMSQLGQEDKEKIIRGYRAAAAFDDWPEGYDPYREHNFGKFEVDNYIFKIDYCSLDEIHGSEHTEDQNTMIRVMTMMSAADY